MDDPSFPSSDLSICSLMPGAPGLMMFMAGMLDGVPGMLGNILGGREDFWAL